MLIGPWFLFGLLLSSFLLGAVSTTLFWLFIGGEDAAPKK